MSNKKNKLTDNELKVRRRVICFSKIPNENGNYLAVSEHNLKVMDLTFLQKLFDVDSNDNDLGKAHLADPLPINRIQAKALESFLEKYQILDLDKYDCELDTYQAPGTEDYWTPPNRK